MSPDKGTLSGRRILVVEDEAMVAMMLVELLTSAGCVVIGPAVTTTEAITLLGQEEIHCAVLDVKLTDGVSIPVAEALAARGIPFVVTTGYGADHIEGYNGAPVVHKAYIPEEVIDAISNLLRPQSPAS
jgi:DNA-binding response OmpR family regulator